MVTPKPLFIVDIMKDIVSKVSAKLTPEFKLIDEFITAVHYMHGHPKEIIETLAQKDKSDTLLFDKYPLIALFQDFPERYNNMVEAPNELTLHIIIARATRPEYKAAERYDNNFRPFLYPIYMELMKQIFVSGKFLLTSSDNIRHTKIDRLYWGREGLYGNEANIFNDFVDVIEIRDLKLQTYLKYC